MQVQSGINRQGDHPSGALVPVTAVTFEAPRVGAPNCLVTPHTLQLRTGQTDAHFADAVIIYYTAVCHVRMRLPSFIACHQL